MKARLYVDDRCVYYEKALMESGTLSTKCNSVVVLQQDGVVQRRATGRRERGPDSDVHAAQLPEPH